MDSPPAIYLAKTPFLSPYQGTETRAHDAQIYTSESADQSPAGSLPRNPI